MKIVVKQNGVWYHGSDEMERISRSIFAQADATQL